MAEALEHLGGNEIMGVEYVSENTASLHCAIISGFLMAPTAQLANNWMDFFQSLAEHEQPEIL